MINFEIKAYGKINPFLQVGAKRADGFHDIVTVMQRASVYDTITLTETEERGVTITTDNDTLPCGKDNLVYRAVEMLHRNIEKPIETLKTGYNVRIEKRIPIAGGMGGGSADAGYTLKHLNKALGAPLSEKELWTIAAELGSDVPFFLSDEEAMLATGRGEILTPCPALPQCEMEFISCGKKPSTGAMFAALDNARNNSVIEAERSPETILNALKQGELHEICECFYNSFEAVFRAQGEEYEKSFVKAKEELTARGAVGVLLCGSGPTVCGIFEKSCR